MNQFQIPFTPQCQPNTLEQHLQNIEFLLKRINDRLDKLDVKEQNTNMYIQKDDNLYML